MLIICFFPDFFAWMFIDQFFPMIDNIFQALAAIPILWTPFLGVSLVFMLLYMWSREYPNAQVNIYGLVALKVC